MLSSFKRYNLKIQTLVSQPFVSHSIAVLIIGNSKLWPGYTNICGQFCCKIGVIDGVPHKMFPAKMMNEFSRETKNSI